MSDQETRLEHVLAQLGDGRITTSQAAAVVRTMKFPAAARRTAFQVQEDASLPDVRVPDADSFFMVSQAYTAGRITRYQYEALQQAAADVIKAAGRQHGGSSEFQQEEAEPGS